MKVDVCVQDGGAAAEAVTVLLSEGKPSVVPFHESYFLFVFGIRCVLFALVLVVDPLNVCGFGCFPTAFEGLAHSFGDCFFFDCQLERRSVCATARLRAIVRFQERGVLL